MLARKIKEQMRRGEPSIGSWMSMAHPSIAEILAMAGYDWIVIETEHTAIDVSEVLRLIIAIEQRGSVPLGMTPFKPKPCLTQELREFLFLWSIPKQTPN